MRELLKHGDLVRPLIDFDKQSSMLVHEASGLGADAVVRCHDQNGNLINQAFLPEELVLIDWVQEGRFDKLDTFLIAVYPDGHRIRFAKIAGLGPDIQPVNLLGVPVSQEVPWVTGDPNETPFHAEQTQISEASLSRMPRCRVTH